jgi:predicted Zn-dependent peptidase
VRRRAAALLLLTALWPAALRGAAAALWNNNIQRIVLPNGLVLLYQKDSSSAITSLDILIKGGRRAEPEGLSGLAYLTARLMLEIPDNQSAQQLMIQASPLSLTSQADYNLISIDSLSDHLEETLRIISKPLQWPLFTGIRIEAIKKYMASQRDRESDAALGQGRAMQLQALFGPTGYGASTYGTPETVKAIKGRDISQFYDTHFQTTEVILSVVSDLEAQTISGLLTKYLKDVHRRQPAEPPGRRPMPPPAPQELRAEKDTLQSLLSAAYPLPGVTDRSFALASLAESLLGKGIASRLWRLRQEEKLAYSVNSHYLPMKESSLLEAYLVSENGKKETALEALRRTLRDVWEKGISADELEAAKKIALTDLLRDNEAKDKRAINLAVYEALGLGYDFLERIPALYETVTVEEMNSFLSDSLNPERAVWVVLAGTKQKPPPRPSRP